MQNNLKSKIQKLAIALISIAIVALIFFVNRDKISKTIIYDPDYNYAGLLKSAKGYDSSDNTKIDFTYEDTDAEDLAELRTKYKLDEVAGSGSDFSKAVNLLKWLHNLIPQQGDAPLPQERDAISLITYAQDNHIGLNCRGLALVLNESLLSVGIKSRYIELVSKYISKDSHVINAAYIPEYNKWVFLDPSFNAYFVDEKGIPLSPIEVRQSFIDNKTLKINSDAIQTGENGLIYTHYISKNIYRFGSKMSFAVGVDMNKDEKFVVLNPIGENIDLYHRPFSSVVIHNAETFWAKPN